jgi:hypothetical protein
MLVVACLSAPGFLAAGEIALVKYAKLKQEFLGYVDFEEFAAPPLPGLSLSYVRRYHGLAVGTHLDGQIIYRSGTGHLGAARLTGRVNSSPRLAFYLGRYSNLSIVQFSLRKRKTNMVVARTYTPKASGYVDNHGRGSIALGLSDRQYAVGMFVHFFDDQSDAYRQVRFDCYDIEGRRINRTPVVITKAGYYGFATTSLKREIYAITMVAEGAAKFAIDDIVFEIPMFIGRYEPEGSADSAAGG